MNSLYPRFRSFVIDQAAKGLALTGVVDSRLRQSDQWLIITFHRVLPDKVRSEYPLPNLAVTPGELSWIIRELRPYFDFHTVSEAQKLMHSERAVGGTQRPILSLTFDDGQWDNFEYANSVLQLEAVNATFYLPTDFIGSDNLLWHDVAGFIWKASVERNQTAELLRKTSTLVSREIVVSNAKSFVNELKKVSPELRQDTLENLSVQYQSLTQGKYDWARMMTWSEARQLSNLGHEIGSHGMSHQSLCQLDLPSQSQELLYSARKLEQELNSEVTSMCYPNGDYNQDTLDSMAVGSYLNAVTTSWGNNKANTPNFELLRCDMHPLSFLDRHGSYSKERLRMRLAGFLRK